MPSPTSSAPLAPAQAAPRPLLARLRVLLMEHNYWIAHEMTGLLGESGAEVVGPAGRLDDARALAAREPHLDGAVTGVQLGGERADPLVAELLARGVPVLLTTTYPRDMLPGWLHILPCAPKSDGRELGRAAAEAFGQGRALVGP